jgi:hypothetical protein
MTDLPFAADPERLSAIPGRKVSAVAVEASNPTVLSHVWRLKLEDLRDTHVAPSQSC